MMLDIAIMLEGQNGLNWNNFRRIAELVEQLGFAGLYRSDHFTNPEPPDYDSLDAWVSLAWLASHTERIEFGPLVSPVTFRDPVQLARTAMHIDELSGGRLTLGLGAGWQEREHASYGYELGDVATRFARFEEALEVITRLLRADDPASFSGRHYTLDNALLLPRPHRPGGPPILIGGNGPKRTLPLVARYADEWNAVFQTPDGFRELNATLDRLLRDAGREPGDVRRSVMTGTALGRDREAVEQRLRPRGSTVEEARARGVIAGTFDEVPQQLAALELAGVQRVMLQWLNLRDLNGLRALAGAVYGS